MADIELVIKIDEELYNYMQTEKFDEHLDKRFDYQVRFAVKNGTPLPRCKDCKYQVKEWREDKRFKDNGYWVYGCKVISDICGYWAWFGPDDEFCSAAERRGEEE